MFLKVVLAWCNHYSQIIFYSINTHPPQRDSLAIIVLALYDTDNRKLLLVRSVTVTGLLYGSIDLYRCVIYFLLYFQFWVTHCYRTWGPALSTCTKLSRLRGSSVVVLTLAGQFIYVVTPTRKATCVVRRSRATTFARMVKPANVLRSPFYVLNPNWVQEFHKNKPEVRYRPIVRKQCA